MTAYNEIQCSELYTDKQRIDFLNEHPDSVPYLEDGLWRIPYLMYGAGGFGGGVGEMTHRTLRGVIDAAMTNIRSQRLLDANDEVSRAHTKTAELATIQEERRIIANDLNVILSKESCCQEKNECCKRQPTPEFIKEYNLLMEKNMRLREALVNARATLLGLQPDFGGPIAAQMGIAIGRINKVLEGDQ